jgi:hypothetical protein
MLWSRYKRTEMYRRFPLQQYGVISLRTILPLSALNYARSSFNAVFTHCCTIAHFSNSGPTCVAELERLLEPVELSRRD